MSSKIRTVQNSGILYLHVHWAYIIIILVILIGPNHLGCAIGHDYVWT